MVMKTLVLYSTKEVQTYIRPTIFATDLQKKFYLKTHSIATVIRRRMAGRVEGNELWGGGKEQRHTAEGTNYPSINVHETKKTA